jgi:prepilin-type N-terminal cleavage/methylation domain-containing protein
MNRLTAQPAQNRRAFTLLELILALGLTGILLSALYAAMELHWRFSTQGQIEVERAQVARALLTRMSADIRSVSFSVEDIYSDTSGSSTDDGTGDGTDDGSGTDGFSDDTTSTEPAFQFAEPGLAFTGASSGVYGDATTLVLHMIRPYRERIRTDAYTSPLSKSDLKSVAYVMADGDGMLSLTAQGQLAGTESPQQGLVRMDGDQFSLSLSDPQDDPLQSDSQARVLAEEVESVSFEFHDGYEWLSEWDSTYEGRLPNAIGITLTFRAPEFAENSILARAPAESTETFRIVVPLITSGPFEGLSF